MTVPDERSAPADLTARTPNGRCVLRGPSRALLAIVAAAAAVAPSACSGAPSPRVAALGAGSATTTPAGGGAPGAAAAGGSATGPGDIQAAELAFAKCMRANGVPNFPDPTDGGFQVSPGLGPTSPAVEAARATCRTFLPPGPGSGTPPSADELAQMLRVSQCMRQHGAFGFPDPRSSVPSPLPAGTAMVSDIDGVIFVFPASLDTQSQAFTRAAAACQFPLHNH